MSPDQSDSWSKIEHPKFECRETNVGISYGTGEQPRILALHLGISYSTGEAIPQLSQRLFQRTHGVDFK